MRNKILIKLFLPPKFSRRSIPPAPLRPPLPYRPQLRRPPNLDHHQHRPLPAGLLPDAMGTAARGAKSKREGAAVAGSYVEAADEDWVAEMKRFLCVCEGW